MKKLIYILLCLALTAATMSGASAEIIQSRAVIGADLTPQQVQTVYKTFGVQQGSVIQLSLTNAEERAILEGLIDSSVIGTRSISCVYMELTPNDSGMNITTNNVTWCTGEMYANALATAGITDARIIVTAPFAVSGTAALAGIYKAYEDMTGQKLDSTAKEAGTQELTVTGTLAQEIGSSDSASIVSDLKNILNVTGTMSDEELKTQVVEIASRYRITLTDTQIRQLIALCRSLEKLDPDALKNKVTDVQNTIGKVADAKDDVVGFFQTLVGMVQSVQGFIQKLQAFLDKFSN